MQGERIRDIIGEKGLKQYNVARDAGMSKTRLSRIINGKAHLLFAEAIKLGRAIPCDLREFDPDFDPYADCHG